MHQMALERVQIFKIFPTKRSPTHFSGAPAREARQRSTMGKKIW